MNKRILVVDEGTGIQDVFAQTLTSKGFLVAGAGSAQQALEILNTETYDYLVLDIGSDPQQTSDVIAAIATVSSRPGLVLVYNDDVRSLADVKEQALAYSINLLATFSKPIEQIRLAMTFDDLLLAGKSEGSAEAVLSESDFMSGLMSDGLAPIFQPKLNVKDGSLESAEVLARWKAPGGGLLGAGAVIKLATEKGYMDVFTYRMLELAMIQQARWIKEGHNIRVSINISAENLRKPDFADVVTGLTEQYDVPAHLIRLEITESDLDIDARAPLETLAHLHERGFGLGLDDFGSGFATLLGLEDIPFDEIVVDRKFLARAAKSKKATIIFAAAIDLAHKLGLSCTCEGVENEEQLALVRSLGGDVVQGYLIGKPMSAEEFLIWIEDHRDGFHTLPDTSKSE